LSKANDFFKGIAILSVLIMMVLSTLDVIIRGAFDVALGPVMSICETMMVVMTFAGLAKTEEVGANINVTVLTMHLSENKQRILRIVSSTVCLIFFIILLYATIQDGIFAFDTKAYRSGCPWRFPVWWARLFVPLGVLIMIGQLVQNIKSNWVTHINQKKSLMGKSGMEGSGS